MEDIKLDSSYQNRVLDQMIAMRAKLTSDDFKFIQKQLKLFD